MQFSRCEKKDKIRVYKGSSKKFEDLANKNAIGIKSKYRSKDSDKIRRMSYNADKFQDVMVEIYQVNNMQKIPLQKTHVRKREQHSAQI